MTVYSARIMRSDELTRPPLQLLTHYRDNPPVSPILPVEDEGEVERERFQSKMCRPMPLSNERRGSRGSVHLTTVCMD